MKILLKRETKKSLLLEVPRGKKEISVTNVYFFDFKNDNTVFCRTEHFLKGPSKRTLHGTGEVKTWSRLKKETLELLLRSV